MSASMGKQFPTFTLNRIRHIKTYVGEMRNALKFCSESLEGRDHLEDVGVSRKTGLGEIGWEGVVQFHLA
jgi:hypothetical protein